MANQSPAPEVLARLEKLKASAKGEWQTRIEREAVAIAEAALTELAAATRERDALRGAIYLVLDWRQNAYAAALEAAAAALAPRSPEGEG